MPFCLSTLLLAQALASAPGAAPAALPAPVEPAPPSPDFAPPILHATALFFTVRAAEAYLWPDPFAETRLAVIADHYREAFTKPPLYDGGAAGFQWDHDPWVINVVGHGLLGSELYLRARSCHFGPYGASAFAAGSSAVWEYVFEGTGVRPSAVDLFYTPLAGMLIGETRYRLGRAAAGIASPAWRSAVQIALDPFGELERRSGMFGC